ncbi:hypothetical protein [Alteromonas macleodii]|uniref:PEP-CTERM protein-sorting domain-containing protein n=1 Tax=Alteromonas macleodii TaxID=28108 RepID=A0A6T9Y1H1_ALTMA|nr:hypothetical protein [Alteromonas macleodii]CAB9494922.1 conserved exported protein of unknown function [Alteromonas macleodii]
MKNSIKNFALTCAVCMCMATSAFATPIFSGTELVDPDLVRKNVTLTKFGDLTLRNTSWGFWDGTSQDFLESYNIIIFDIPITEFPFLTALLSYQNNPSVANPYLTMDKPFNLNNFEAAAFFEDGFNRFRMQLVGGANGAPYNGQDFYLENIYLGNYTYVAPPATNISEPSSISILACLVALIAFGRKAKAS